MKNNRQITDIIDQFAPDIASGQETIDSIIEKNIEFTDELKPQLEALQWMTNARKGLDPRPGFVSSTREYIEHRAASLQPEDLWTRIFKRYTPQHWAFYLTAPALIIVLLAFIINSLVLTAQLALPGDQLYPTKVLIENLRLAITFDEAKKTELYIQYTRERSSEIVDLALDGNYEAIPSAASLLEGELISSLNSLNMLNRQDPSLARPMTIELRETLSSELFMMGVLRSSTPPSNSSGINLAINVTLSGLLALR